MVKLGRWNPRSDGPPEFLTKRIKKIEENKLKKEKEKKQRMINKIDLDKCCGVLDMDQEIPCKHNINTCKSHSLESKKQVQGRSKPIDELIAQYKVRTINLLSHQTTEYEKQTSNIVLRSYF